MSESWLKRERTRDRLLGFYGAISSVGGKDELLGLCFGFIISIEWLIRKWYAFIDMDDILAIEDHTGRTGINKFRKFVFLGGSNNSLGTVYVYLPVEGC